MLFNSYIFILVFLPVCLAGYFALNHFGHDKAALCFLLGMSLWFYGYFHIRYLVIILFSVAVNFLFYRMLRKASAQKNRNSILAVGLAVNLLVLAYFKYMDFFITILNVTLGLSLPLLRIMLPLGISFFTFQQISFLIDAWRGECPAYSFLEYACYVTYFPQLVAGPIVTHDELIPQFRNPEQRKPNWDNLSRGMYLFVLGLAKKILIADVFGNAVNIGFSDAASLNSCEAVISMLAYTIQIYFDFSGYCDMASGIARMMNFTLPANFNSPYKATTITEFWSRWHMTLTRFLTRYVYIPLGGNRKGTLRTYGNVMIVFFLSGLWHGAGMEFIVWGLLHGIFSVITRHFKRFFSALPGVVGWAVTFLFVNITWVFFRSGSISSAIIMLRQILRGGFGPIRTTMLACFRLPEWQLLNESVFHGGLPVGIFLPLYLAAAFLMMLGCKNSAEQIRVFRPTCGRMAVFVLLTVWSVLSLSGVSTFLYFNF